MTASRTTRDWAQSLGVTTDETLPPVKGIRKRYTRSARDIAIRTIVLQGIIAVAYGVEPAPILKWFRTQRIWRVVTPKERAFLSRAPRTKAERTYFQWQQETQWTLLWMISRVKSLGLPTGNCDTGRIADEIMPRLGESIAAFVRQSKLRPAGKLLAEDDRTYNLWCYALAAQKRKDTLPDDLNLGVLKQRRYAFEWLDGNQAWDEVTCDA